MRKMYFIGGALFIALMAGAIITSGGRFVHYLNIPSFLMVAGCTFVLLLMNFSVREMGRAFKVGFQSGKGADKDRIEDLKKGFVFFKSMQTYLIVSGFLGTVVGAIAMLASMNNVMSVSFGAALAIITALYGLFFSMLITVPFSAGIRKRLIEAGEELPAGR